MFGRANREGWAFYASRQNSSNAEPWLELFMSGELE
jgi:hypothetical protein